MDYQEESIEEEEVFTEDDDALALKLKKIKDELKQCRKEKEEYLTGWQRTRADFVNARKEEEKHRKEVIAFAEKEIILDLIELAATFDRAFQGQDDNNPYTQGFRHIQSQLSAMLRQHGVEVITTRHQQFDVIFHEAVENVPVSNEDEDGIIVEEVERGYTMHGQVIKPSKVKVGIYKRNQ